MARFFLILVFLLSHISCFSAIIILKNGDQIKGEIVSQDINKIKVVTDIGNVTLKKSDIKDIIKTKPEMINVYLKDKRVLRGLLIEQDDKKLILKKENKQINIPKWKIERIDWKNKPTFIDPKNRFFYMSPGEIRWQSVWRSTILPSWGQFYQGKTAKGWIIASASVLSISTLFYSYIKHQFALNEWNSGNKSAEQHDKITIWSNTYSIMSILTATIWILNILDAAFFLPPHSPEKKMNLSLYLEPESHMIGLSFSSKF